MVLLPTGLKSAMIKTLQYLNPKCLVKVTPNIHAPKEALVEYCINIDDNYFLKLPDSVTNRLQSVIKAKTKFL